jgi:hypothetical protein
VSEFRSLIKFRRTKAVTGVWICCMPLRIDFVAGKYRGGKFYCKLHRWAA